MDSDDLIFIEEDEPNEEGVEQPWEILLVDDEESVHQVTRLALRNFKFKDRPLNITSVFSKDEAIKALSEKNFAAAFIDIIMENDDTGLELTNYIRQILEDKKVRIIIRTGQPGMAPERYVIDHYDINDYKEKTELTSDKIYTTVRTALAQYHHLLELEEKNRELQYRMTHDVLTHLPNRTKLNEDLANDEEASLFLIDLDAFSMINDAYGFAYGNKVLINFAQALKKMLKKGETAYYLEADVFVLLAKGVNQERIEQIKNTLLILSNNYSFKDDEVTVKVSFTTGAVIQEKEKLLEKAQMAFREARTISRNRLQVYTETMHIIDFMEETTKWTKLLKHALEHDGIIPFFQPILNVKSQKIYKYEALARMQIHDAIIVPTEFLPAARYAGLLHDITKVILEKTSKLFADNEHSFSINVTDQDFKEPTFTSFVKTTLNHYKIKPQRVIFELLEENSLTQVHSAMQTIKELSDFGCKISIDDFGVKCSNYAQLLTHELESIKIDGSFVRNIDHSSSCYKVVDAIVYFCRQMDVRTVAEFVHSKEVYEKVAELGVDYVQGFYIGKPTPDIN